MRSLRGTTALRVLLCAALAFAQSALLAHRAFVSHRVCAEHGEVVHGQPAQLDSVIATVPRALPTLLPTSPAESQHGHDHCSAAATSRQRYLPAAQQAGTPSSPSAVAHASSLFVSPPPPLAPLVVAPKASPPSSIG